MIQRYQLYTVTMITRSCNQRIVFETQRASIGMLASLFVCLLIVTVLMSDVEVRMLHQKFIILFYFF